MLLQPFSLILFSSYKKRKKRGKAKVVKLLNPPLPSLFCAALLFFFNLLFIFFFLNMNGVCLLSL
jgi:hypothetical protein